MLNNLRPVLTTSRGLELAGLTTGTGKHTLGQSLEEMASPGSRYSVSLASFLLQSTLLPLLPLVQSTVLPLLALLFKRV